MTALIQALHLTQTFGTAAGGITAVDDVSLEVDAGEVVAITGPSGAGKSTLLAILAALQEPADGRVLIEGKDVAALPESEMLELRARRLGYVFQEFGLLDELTAAENVELPLRIQRRDPVERSRLVEEVLAAVELTPHAAQRPEELSGGQRQRVAVARALVTAPQLLLADEPTAQLDARTAASVTELLVSAARERGAAVVIVSHDEQLLGRADRVLHLRAGRLEATSR